MIRFREIFRSESGFTLIELLVVIAVLGILAGIAVPRMMNVQNSAKEAAARSDLRIIQSALEMFYINNDEEYPTAWSDTDESGDAFSTYVSIDTSKYVFEEDEDFDYKVVVDYDSEEGYDLQLTPNGIEDYTE